MEWISVENKLPDKNGDYLVYWGNNKYWKDTCFVREYRDGLWWQDGYDGDESNICHDWITHWMPLPVLPEGK